MHLQPDLKVPVKNEEIKTFCCFFCSSDPCIVVFKLPFTGYVPGQIIEFEIDFNNNSDIEITETRVTLRKTIKYESDMPEPNAKYEIQDLVKVTAPRIGGKVKSVHDGQLQIPYHIDMSNSHCCRVVQISYELRVEAVTVGCHGNIEITTPITIGSVPLQFIASAPQLLGEK